MLPHFEKYTKIGYYPFFLETSSSESYYERLQKVVSTVIENDIPSVEKIGPDRFKLVTPPAAGGISKGGMDSKLRAAQIAAKAGCTVVIADGRKAGRLGAIIAGKDVGTIIPGTTL